MTDDTSNDIAHPHDRFFRHGIAYRQVYQPFLQQFLPKEVRERLDFESIQHSKTTYVDNKLRASHTDCLFSATIDKQDSYIYILVEHQSSPDKNMTLRLWKYMLNIWDDHTKAHKTDRLPVIVPLLLYNGRQRYNQSLLLKDMIDGPKPWTEALFNQPITLIALNQTEDDAWQDLPSLDTFLGTMKHIWDATFPIDRLVTAILETFKDQDPVDFLIAFCTYTLEVRQDLRGESLIEYMYQRRPDLEGTMETSLDRFIKERSKKFIEQALAEGEDKGLAKGRAEGLTKGRAEGLTKGRVEGLTKGIEETQIKTAKELLRIDMVPQMIAQCTGLSIERVRQLVKELKRQNPDHA